MIGLYLLMCFHVATSTWVPLTGKLHENKFACVVELMEHADYRCRCLTHIAVLEPDTD